MKAYVIDVSKIEELQNLNNKDELETIFYRANSTVVNGEKVILVRKNKNGGSEKFDEITTQEDLEQFRKRVFKYLKWTGFRSNNIQKLKGLYLYKPFNFLTKKLIIHLQPLRFVQQKRSGLHLSTVLVIAMPGQKPASPK